MYFICPPYLTSAFALPVDRKLRLFT